MSSGINPYDAEFHLSHANGSLSSAHVIAPLVIDLVKPVSVIDVGCGIGTWLRAFADLGVTDYLGLDGDYIDRSELLIPVDKFRPADLMEPPSLGRKFDLAVCLEVVEHLPESVANMFVDYLVNAAPVILFSAALPGQGGTNHINEQWPYFWRQRFEQQNYSRLDPIRPKVWRDRRVEWWYQQNIYLYVNESVIATNPRLDEEYELSKQFPFELVYDYVMGKLHQATTVRGMVTALPGAVIKAANRVVSRSGN